MDSAAALGIITWALFPESGIHATISGVVLGFLVPVEMSARSGAAQAEHGLAEVLEHRFRPSPRASACPSSRSSARVWPLAALKASDAPSPTPWRSALYGCTGCR